MESPELSTSYRPGSTLQPVGGDHKGLRNGGDGTHHPKDQEVKKTGKVERTQGEQIQPLSLADTRRRTSTSIASLLVYG